MPESMTKALATAQARAALRGMVLHCIESDNGRPTYIATFHALTKAFSDMAEVERWLNRVDGQACSTFARARLVTAVERHSGAGCPDCVPIVMQPIDLISGVGGV